MCDYWTAGSLEINSLYNMPVKKFDILVEDFKKENGGIELEEMVLSSLLFSQRQYNQGQVQNSLK